MEILKTLSILDIIGLLGSVASIGAAIWAAISVRIITKTKNEILSRLKIVKYSEITSASKSTIFQLKKIINKSKIPPGINFDLIIESINDYYEGLNTIRNEVKDDGYLEIENHMSNLKTYIKNANKLNRKDGKILIEQYTEIYYHILEIDNHVSKSKRKIINQ